MIVSEELAIEQIWVTNQSTDSHLVDGKTGELKEGISYRVHGVVASTPRTGTGGHVSFTIHDGDHNVQCMAYEPTKGFRNIVRQLVPGDEVVAVGSFKKGSINLEKMQVCSLTRVKKIRPPVCTLCKKRMTSDGRKKGYKCKKCGARAGEPEVQDIPRMLSPGWYEVPPTARRHLAKPLCRGVMHIKQSYHLAPPSSKQQ
jgi:tRNA(Ile2)-agmatinylcytidine synthase